MTETASPTGLRTKATLSGHVQELSWVQGLPHCPQDSGTSAPSVLPSLPRRFSWSLAYGWQAVGLKASVPLPAVLCVQTVALTVISSGKPKQFVQGIPLHFLVYLFHIHDLGLKTSLRWTWVVGSGGWVLPRELWKEVILPITWKCCFPKVLSSCEYFLLLFYKEGQCLTEMIQSGLLNILHCAIQEIDPDCCFLILANGQRICGPFTLIWTIVKIFAVYQPWTLLSPSLRNSVWSHFSSLEGNLVQKKCEVFD